MKSEQLIAQQAQDILNMAAAIKKPNKRDILSHLQDVIHSGDYLFTHVELAEIYAYFIPAIPKKSANPELWAAVATAKKDVRDYLNYLYSDGERLIGCDGHRIHWIETDRETGYFHPSTLDKLDNKGGYPDIDRVIPETYSADLQQHKRTGFDVVECGGDYGLAYALPNGSRLLKRYVDEAYSRDSEMLIYMRDADNTESMKFESLDGKRHAVIMPIRIPKED